MAIYGINAINEMYNNSNEIFSFSKIFESVIIETNDVIRELNEYRTSLQEATYEESKKSIIKRIINALKKIKDIFIRTITRLKNAINDKLKKISINNLKNALKGVSIDPGNVDYYEADINKLYDDILRCTTFSDNGTAQIMLEAKKDQLNKIKDNFIKDYTTRKEMEYSNIEQLCKLAETVTGTYTEMTNKLNKIMQDIDERIKTMTSKLENLLQNQDMDDELVDNTNASLEVLNLALEVISSVNMQIMDLNNGVYSTIESYL